MTRRRVVFKRNKKQTRLKSEDAGFQRTDLILCEASRLDNIVCVHEKPLITQSAFYTNHSSLLFLLKTMEVQIQFTSWPKRVTLHNVERKTERQRRCIQNKNKHHSSFRLSVQRVKNNLEANPL